MCVCVCVLQKTTEKFEKLANEFNPHDPWQEGRKKLLNDHFKTNHKQYEIKKKKKTQ